MRTSRALSHRNLEKRTRSQTRLAYACCDSSPSPPFLSPPQTSKLKRPVCVPVSLIQKNARERARRKQNHKKTSRRRREKGERQTRVIRGQKPQDISASVQWARLQHSTFPLYCICIRVYSTPSTFFTCVQCAHSYLRSPLPREEY